MTPAPGPARCGSASSAPALTSLDMAGSTAKEFFGDSAQRSADWVRYGDTKAGVVVIALGVGLVNLLDNAEGLIDAHKQAHPSWVGWVATVCFYLALAAAGVGVLWMAKALFPAL